MIWGIEFLQEAEKDMKRLDHSVQIQVMKIIVISARTDEQVYKEASKRRKEHNIYLEMHRKYVRDILTVHLFMHN